MAPLRRSLISAAALGVYLAAGITGWGLHQHAEKSPASARATAACGGGRHLHPAGPAIPAAEPHACPICTVLHQAQARPNVVRFAAAFASAGNTVVASHDPYPRFRVTATHSRSPPPPQDLPV